MELLLVYIILTVSIRAKITTSSSENKIIRDLVKLEVFNYLNSNFFRMFVSFKQYLSDLSQRKSVRLMTLRGFQKSPSKTAFIYVQIQ